MKNTQNKHKIASRQLISLIKQHGKLRSNLERFPLDRYDGRIFYANKWQDIFNFRHLIIIVADFADGGTGYVFLPQYAPTEEHRKCVSSALQYKETINTYRLNKFGTGNRRFFEKKLDWFRNREGEWDFHENGPDMSKPRLPKTGDRIRHHIIRRNRKGTDNQQIFF